MIVFMRKCIVSILCILLLTYYSASQEQSDSLITQTFTYKTSKAGELYMVWAVNNWQEPAKIYVPTNSFLKKSMAWTKMERMGNSFSLRLTLPIKTQMNMMFWVPVDSKGDSTDGWDSYGNIFYTTTFTEEKHLSFFDDALWMPETKKQFSLLTSGKHIFYISLLIALAITMFYRIKSFSIINFISGFLIGSIIITGLIKAEINNLFFNQVWQIHGAIFWDMLLLFSLTCFFYMLYSLFRQKVWVRSAVITIFALLLFGILMLSILNIEIVKQLGRPLNYQWLYYSDFLQGTDAKNALKYSISNSFIINILLIVFSVLLVALSIAFLPPKAAKKTSFILVIVASFILLVGFLQLNSFSYNKNYVKSPSIELVASAFTAEMKPKLFTMTTSKSVEQYVEKLHIRKIEKKIDSALQIDNVILFVFESTPKDLVSLYDTTIPVTSNLKKWSFMATRFDNMYAHIPSTPNSMLSLVSGIYPLISYKSFLNEYPNTSLPALPNELRKANWTTSFFSSSDLNFSNMGLYASKNGFEVVEDDKSITCIYKKFETTNTSLDGLNDKCIVKRYLQWNDANKTRKKYSMIWTNQTHYPYFVDGKNEVKYVGDNPNLNRYLNALQNSDEAFGELLEGLQKRGQLNNTLVIVIGDHGEAFGTHNQTSHASYIYEENVHIPCIIYNPVLCRGNSESEIGGLIDIPPTIMHVLSLPSPETWQGRSLFSEEKKNRVFFISPYSDFLFGTRSEEWKYIYNASTNRDELYNLKADPKELKNVAKFHREIVKQEYEILAAWVQYHNRKINAWSINN